MAKGGNPVLSYWLSMRRITGVRKKRKMAMMNMTRLLVSLKKHLV